MSMTRHPLVKLSLFSFVVCLSTLGESAENAPGTRTKLEGSPYFIDEAAVKVKSDVASFKLYASDNPNDPGTESTLNCETREYSARTGDQWSAPSRVIAGEPLYPVGKKLCDWDSKWFFQRFSW